MWFVFNGSRNNIIRCPDWASTSDAEIDCEHNDGILNIPHTWTLELMDSALHFSLASRLGITG